MSRRVTALLLFAAFSLCVGAIAWKVTRPKPPPAHPAENLFPQDIAGAVEAEGVHLHAMPDDWQDKNSAVFLSQENWLGTTRKMWDGMALVEADGHPSKTEPESSTKGPPVWHVGHLTFYGDKDVVERIKYALGY